MIARINFASILLMGCLFLGCNNSAPPTEAFDANKEKPAEVSATIKAAEDAAKEVKEKGMTNVSEETLDKLEPIAGNKAEKFKAKKE